MKALLITLLFILGVYILLCALLYAFQERIIFHPHKLPRAHVFQFNLPQEEKSIIMHDGTMLNALLFKADRPKGVILYLHGNGGSLDSWGWVAQTYTGLNYDVFMLDYRGYGKSEGTIQHEIQLHEDVQTVYDQLLKQYSENQIIVLGYSIGSGLASKVASANNPRLLILQAPYYSIVDEMKQRFPIFPAFILQYPLDNSSHLKSCSMPVVIFHGDLDQVISYQSSLKLQKEFKSGDQLIMLHGAGHNGMNDAPAYQAALEKILSNQ